MHNLCYYVGGGARKKGCENVNRTYRAVSARFLSLILCLAILLLQVPLVVSAETEPRKAVVTTATGGSVNVRSEPGTWNSIVVKVPSGVGVTILDEKKDKDGDVWYHVSFTYGGSTHNGYILSDLVTILTDDPPVTANPMFEAELSAFPESYREALKNIHALHPSWHFEAVLTDLDWSAVQEKENVLGKSFINDGIISHYSTMAGSYDWETDTYYVQEGKNWYQAAPAMVAFYMDPRNFLNENDLFQFEKLAFSSSSQTLENIEKMLQGTFMEGKMILDESGAEISYAKAFLDAGEKYNVSAFHLITRCIQEVGWNGNACTSGSYFGYEGFYNFFNIGAYNGAEDGMKYAKTNVWNTPYKAITAGAGIIGKNYIAVGQNTPYFQKYNVVNHGAVASHQYMTNIAAAQSEGSIQRSKYVQLGFLDAELTFRIPVYKNMPEALCTKPAPAGSPNNYLKTLVVDGYSLTPTFDFYECLKNGVNSYTLTIDGDVPTIQVDASAVSRTATVSGFVGEVNIVTGENILPITCTAANGDERTFTLRVVLNGKGSASSGVIKPPEVIPSGWAPPYKLQGSTVTGLTPGMDIGEFISSLGTYGNASASVVNESGEALSSGSIRTGLKLLYYDGKNTTEFVLTVFGDINKDSAIDAIDLLMIRRNLLGLTTLDASAIAAADVNHDGQTDAIDLLLVRRTLLGLSTITQ